MQSCQLVSNDMWLSPGVIALLLHIAKFHMPFKSMSCACYPTGWTWTYKVYFYDISVFNTSTCMSEIYVYTSLWQIIVWLFVIYLRYCDFTQETECCTSLLLTAVRPIIRQQQIAIELLCCVSFRWYALLCVINFNLPYLCGSLDLDNVSSNILFALHKLFFNTLCKNVKMISHIIIINEMRLFVDHR